MWYGLSKDKKEIEDTRKRIIASSLKKANKKKTKKYTNKITNKLISFKMNRMA